MVMSNLEETNQDLQLAFALVLSRLLHEYRVLPIFSRVKTLLNFC